MKKILVLGIGSRVMVDDGIGLYLVEDLKKQHLNPSIEFIAGETDVDYCYSVINVNNFVVIIDAFFSGKKPGDITVLPLCNLETAKNNLYSMHGLHLLNAIKSHNLEGVLIGIEPYEINYGSNLSDTMQSYYPDILNSVNEHLEMYLDRYGEKINA